MKEFVCRDRGEKILAMMIAERDYYVPKRCMVEIGKTGRKVRVHLMYVDRFKKSIGEARRGLIETHKYYNANLREFLENDDPISDKAIDELAEMTLAGKEAKQFKTRDKTEKIVAWALAIGRYDVPETAFIHDLVFSNGKKDRKIILVDDAYSDKFSKALADARKCIEKKKKDDKIR